MAEYIMREAIRKILENWRDAHASVDDEEGCGLLEDVIWEVDAQPAADVVPVRHGRWIIRGGNNDVFECSNCHSEVWEEKTPYCPYCGAKMEGGAEDAAD